jgi:hypothetical protein
MKATATQSALLRKRKPVMPAAQGIVVPAIRRMESTSQQDYGII